MVFVFYSSSVPSRLDIEGDSGAVNGPMPGFDDVSDVTVWGGGSEIRDRFCYTDKITRSRSRKYG